MSNNKKGFTLVELLVVISIIGLLAALTLIGLRISRAKAQDVQRKADLRSIRTALASYGAENNENYPLSKGDGSGWEALTSTSYTGSKISSSLNSIPQDPDGEPYSYLSVDGTGYILSSKLAGHPGASYVLSDPDDIGGGAGEYLPDYIDTSAPLWDTEFSAVGTADHMVMVTNRQLGKVLYMWDKAYDDNGLVNYKYQYAVVGSNNWVEGPLQSTNFAEITNLDPTKSYDFIVYAYDQVGNESRISVNHMPRERRIDFNAEPIYPDWGPNDGYTLSQTTENILNVNLPGDSSACPILKYKKNNDPDAPVNVIICDRPSIPASGINTVSAHLPVGNYHFWLYNMNISGDYNPLVKEFDYSVQGKTGDTIKPIMKNSLLNASRRLDYKDNGENFTIPWYSGVDNTRVVSYHVTIKGITNPNFSVSMDLKENYITLSLDRGQTYNIQVYATDESGNKSNITGANFGIPSN